MRLLAAFVSRQANAANSRMSKAVSDLARAALTARPEPRARGDRKAVHGFQPFPRRGVVVTNDLIDNLREDDAY